MTLKGSHHRNTTSLYLIESRESEWLLAEARNKKKAHPVKRTKSKIKTIKFL
jgi:hypothetical protein